MHCSIIGVLLIFCDYLFSHKIHTYILIKSRTFSGCNKFKMRKSKPLRSPLKQEPYAERKNCGTKLKAPGPLITNYTAARYTTRCQKVIEPLPLLRRTVACNTHR